MESKPLNSLQQLLEWIVARAQFKWEEAKTMPRHPLELTIKISGWQIRKAVFCFEGTHDNDEASTASKEYAGGWSATPTSLI
jgi:hypothetical protein